MSKLITPWRIVVAAAKHVVRNVWLALATVLVLVLALMSVNVLVGSASCRRRSRLPENTPYSDATASWRTSALPRP
jgi:hypothetical protein